MAQRTDRHRQKTVAAFGTGAIPARTIAAAPGAKNPADTVIVQRVQIVIGHQIHAATIAAVTTIGATKGHVFLATKAQAAIAAITGLDAYIGFIDEFHALHPRSDWRPYYRCSRTMVIRPTQKTLRMAGLFARQCVAVFTRPA